MELRVTDDTPKLPSSPIEANMKLVPVESVHDPTPPQPPPLQGLSQSFYRNAMHFAPSYIPSKPNYYAPPSGPIPEASIPHMAYPQSRSYPHYVTISNLPRSIDQHSLVQLIDSIIETNFEYPEITTYSIIKFIGESKESDSDSDPDDAGSYCVVEVPDWNFALKLIENLNGYVWLQKILDARFLNGHESSPPRSGNYSNSPSPSSELPPPLPGVFPDSAFSLSATTPTQESVPNPYPFYNYQQMPSYSSSYVGGPPPSNYMNPPMPPRFLQRRQSSNRSFESRKTSRSNSVSAFSSTKNSFSSASSLGSNAMAAKQPVPPFIMNMVAQKTDSPPTENANPSDDDSLILKTEEDEAKVNPCRLFVGNVPYSSTWMSLKNFFVQKSKIMRPELNMSILRVEIPMHPSGQGSFDTNTISEMPKPQPMSKSRGFAIVTTGNRESSDALIALFDNAEFEGRSLTVRYDKYPEFNNYVLQQLYSNADKYGAGANVYHGSSVINYLAFERTLFQQKFYYGGVNLNQQPMYPYYSMPPPAPPPISRQSSNPNIQASQYYMNYQRPESKPRANSASQKPFTIEENSNSYDTAKVSRHPNIEESSFKINQQQLNDEEKARELVNSFGDLGIN